MIERLVYFGPGTNNDGHYVWPARGIRYARELAAFDARLAPMPEGHLYIAAVTRLGGWRATAISWWDRSADKRPGSNSIIFAPTLTVHPADVMEQAKKEFGWVFDRLPAPVVMPPEWNGARPS